MNTYEVIKNKNFIGRKKELSLLKELDKKDEAQILICYGRRRVGKTELIEQAFIDGPLYKFEGLKGKNDDEEKRNFLLQYQEYFGLLKTENSEITWRELFLSIYKKLNKGHAILYLEELQWMACYRGDLLAELKYCWDNFFKKNPKFRLVLCGSATSFMLTEVVRSQVLYNRGQTIIELKEFSLNEAQLFLGKKYHHQDVMDIYLAIGGIPEYLKQIKRQPSLLLNLAEQSFTKTGFFTTEIDRIFVSHFAERKYYKTIIDFLSQNKYAYREEIIKHLKLKSSGKLSEILEDLEVCNFISRQAPLKKTSTSKINRFQISDSYLRFYYKFIAPKNSAILRNQFEKNPIQALNNQTFKIWLGHSFEYWCLMNATSIASMLGFSGIEYQAGPLFFRANEEKGKGIQFDLVFDRSDRVLSFCEIKYTSLPVGKEVAGEFENKLNSFGPFKKTIQKVLISYNGAKPELYQYFDRIITSEDLISAFE